MVCDSFHDIRAGVRDQVNCRVLTAQRLGPEASLAMLNGFGEIAQVLEDNPLSYSPFVGQDLA